MATAALPQDPDLDRLRNQARELQRAVRGGEPTALVRVSRWHPEPPAPNRFPLSAAQLVLAREHGFASWARLRRYVQVVTARAWTPAKPAPANESLADRFLRLACLTYSEDEPADRSAAAQLLAEHPGLPRHNLFVAAACADTTAVRRHLGERQAAAGVTGRPSTTACSAPTTTIWFCYSSTASVAIQPVPGPGCSVSPSSHPPRCCAPCWPGRHARPTPAGQLLGPRLRRGRHGR